MNILTNIGNWLQGHVWLCTYIIAGLAILTFLLNFIFKRNKKSGSLHDVKNVKIKAGRFKKSTVNQSAGDMTINNNSDGSKQ